MARSPTDDRAAARALACAEAAGDDGRRLRVGIRLRVLPRRHGGTLLSELAHRSRSRALRRPRVSPVPGPRRHRLRRSRDAPIASSNSAAAVRARPSSRPSFATMRSTCSSIPELGMDAHIVRAGRAAPRAAADRRAGAIRSRAVTPTIDAYITCGDMEPADAAAHYIEPLLRLPGIGTCYRRPAVPERVGARAHRPARRSRRCCYARSRCSRCIRTTTNCSRACSPRIARRRS